MPTGMWMPSCPSTEKPRWITWTISRSCGMATARACSSARETSTRSICPCGTAMAPRLFTEDTCAPARLTSAEVSLQPGGLLGLLHRTGDGLRGRAQVHDDTLADALRRLDAHAQDADGLVILHTPDQRADLGRANVNASQYLFHHFSIR